MATKPKAKPQTRPLTAEEKWRKLRRSVRTTYLFLQRNHLWVMAEALDDVLAEMRRLSRQRRTRR